MVAFELICLSGLVFSGLVAVVLVIDLVSAGA